MGGGKYGEVLPSITSLGLAENISVH